MARRTKVTVRDANKDELKKSLLSLNAVKTEIEAAAKNKEGIFLEISAIQTVLSNLRTKMSDEKASCKAVTVKTEDLKSKYEAQLEAYNVAKKAHESEHNKILTSAELELRALAGRGQQMVAAYGKMVDQYNTSESEFKSLKSEIKASKSEKTSLSKLIEQLSDEKDSLEESVEKLELTDKTLSKNINSFVSDVEGLKAESKAYKGEIQAILKNKKGKSDEIKNLGDQISVGKVAIAEQDKKLDELKKQNLNLAEKEERLNKKEAALRKKYSKSGLKY